MLRHPPPGYRSSVPAHRTHHAHRAKGCVVPCSTSVAAAEQGRSSALAQRKGHAGSVQRCPGVPAVAGGTQERAEGRDGGVWAAGPGDRARRRRVVKARTRRAVAAEGRPERCATAARRYRSSVTLHARCARWFCLGILSPVQMYTVQKVTISPLDRTFLVYYELILNISC